MMLRTDGGIVDIELLRPTSIVEKLGLEPGVYMPFEVEELKSESWATVVSIESCPPIHDGDGSVITG